MTSTYSAVACPQCNCCATKNDAPFTNEEIIFCFRCGYHYIKIITSWKNSTHPLYTEKEYIGYGIYRVQYYNGQKNTKIFHRPVSNKEIIKQANRFLNEEVNREKSYFIIYRNNEFLTLAGTPPQNYFLPFEEYIQVKDNHTEELDTIIPI